MKKWSFSILIYSLILFAIACGGGGGGTDNGPSTDDDNTGSITDPSAATLVFPDNNEICNEGSIIDDTRSSVIFSWNPSQNTDSYSVTVTNLNTNNSIFRDSSTESVEIIIDRGMPYEWFVTSKAIGTNVTAESPRWRFYNEGPGIQNFAPFPAEAIQPVRGANLSGITSVDVIWNGQDVDDDIVEYEIFLDTNSDPTSSLGTTSETSITDVSVSAGNTYYWKVITRDSQSNSSTSEIFQFRID
jgi:hypothetical protein